jgi:hypothetical protein
MFSAATHLGCSRQSERAMPAQQPRLLAAVTKPMSEKWPQAIFLIN